MPTPREVSEMYKHRLDLRSPIQHMLHQVKSVYEGTWSIPLPEMDKNERPAVANILAMGVDQVARRIASVMPSISSDPTSMATQIAEDRARSRVLAAQGWWKMDAVPTKRYRRARFLAAYGTSPILISPVSLTSDTRKIPYMHLKDPMHSYPAECADYDDIEPENCIFVTERSIKWLTDRYPMEMAQLRKGNDKSKRLKLLEYVDADCTMLIVLADESAPKNIFASGGGDGIQSEIQLGATIPNRMGICPVVYPGRITLGAPVGQFMQTIGVIQRQAMLDALTDIAVRQNVFPEKWVETLPQAPGAAEIIEVAQPMQGKIGEIKWGHLNVVRPVPNQEASLREDQLERAARLNGNVPSELGGESGSNIRTARRGEMVLGSAMDLVIQEYQDILQRSDEAELRRRIECQVKYFPGPTKYYFLPGESQKPGEANGYDPRTIWNDSKQLCVEYPMPGMDAASMTVAMGQKVGMGVLSRRSAMKFDPSVKDDDEEYAQIEVEGINDALKQSVQQLIASGQMQPQEAARIAVILETDRVSIGAAIRQAHDEAQKEQAAQQQDQAAQGAQGADQGLPGGAPPEQQPGLQAPPQAPPSIQQPPQGASNLLDLLQTQHPAAAGAPANAAA